MKKSNEEMVSGRGMVRFGLVSEFKARRLRGQSVAEAIRQMAGCAHFDPQTNKSIKFSERTLYRWLKKFDQEGGISALSNAPRVPRQNRKFSDPFWSFIESQKIDDPAVSVPELIRRARVKGVIGAYEKICRTTVYRACLKLNLAVGKVHATRTDDMRRFSYPHRMQLIMCDGKYFNVGMASTKRLALFFIDDATRMLLHVSVGSSENTELFLTGLHNLFLKFGLPDMIYLDRGPAFICSDTAKVLATLGVRLILGRARYPQARGKIERFHYTASAQLLRTLDKRPDIDTDFSSLENLIGHYVREDYNKSIHSSLNNKSPDQCFYDATARPLKLIADRVKYDRSFLIRERKKVSADNTVLVDGLAYEMPFGYAGKYVDIWRSALTGDVVFMHQDAQIKLTAIDVHKNADGHRRKKVSQPYGAQLPAISAAEAKYRQSYLTLLDEDGNYKPQEHL